MRRYYHKRLAVMKGKKNTGFDEQGSFARFFKRETGMTPTEYRGR